MPELDFLTSNQSVELIWCNSAALITAHLLTPATTFLGHVQDHVKYDKDGLPNGLKKSHFYGPLVVAEARLFCMRSPCAVRKKLNVAIIIAYRIKLKPPVVGGKT